MNSGYSSSIRTATRFVSMFIWSPNVLVLSSVKCSVPNEHTTPPTNTPTRLRSMVLPLIGTFSTESASRCLKNQHAHFQALRGGPITSITDADLEPSLLTNGHLYALCLWLTGIPCGGLMPNEHRARIRQHRDDTISASTEGRKGEGIHKGTKGGRTSKAPPARPLRL
jgi:hypothetical protein